MTAQTAWVLLFMSAQAPCLCLTRELQGTMGPLLKAVSNKGPTRVVRFRDL